MKIFLTLISIIFSLSLYSQIEYPKYEIDSLGQKVVVMTISQAQKLDKNSDMLALFEKLNVQISDYDSVCVKALDECGIVVSTKNVEIYKLKESLNNKDVSIKILQNEISEHIKKEERLKTQVDNNDSIIKEKNKQIRKMKVKMIGGGLGGGLAIIGLVLLYLRK